MSGFSTPVRDHSVAGWVEETVRCDEKATVFPIQLPDKTPEYWISLRNVRELENPDSSNELARRYMRDGNLFYDHSRYYTAIAHFSVALQLNCSNNLKAELFNRRSKAYYAVGNFESALKDVEEVEKFSPIQTAAVRKAECLLRLEKYEECIKFLKEFDLCEYKVHISKIDRLKKEAAEKQRIKDDVAQNNVEKTDRSGNNLVEGIIHD